LKWIELSQKGSIKRIATSGVFLYVGLEPAINYCDLKLKTNDEGYLTTDSGNQTSQKGIFAAGDVTCKLKHAITACGDGANAYYFAKKYIDTQLP
jgi:thioredoxin reductase